MRPLNMNEYNQRVSALISIMCLNAYEKYDKEKSAGTPDRMAIARAIGDTIKESIIIYSNGFTIDRELIQRGYTDKDGFLKHCEEETIYLLAKEIFNSKQYRVEKFNNMYEVVHKYEIATFRFPEIKEFIK